MRVIEQRMIAAIRAGVTDKTLGNTRVHAIIGGHEVQLHGNTIAHVLQPPGMSATHEVRFTLAGWPTPTTRSRINALLREFANDGHKFHGVGQNKGRQEYQTWYRDQPTTDRREISSTELVTV